MPLVSICIPTYNHGRFLGEALRSACSQTFTDLEIIVLDNDSQDDTTAIVEEFAAGDSRIRYIKHPRNLGLVGNLNACIRCAGGDYIKILCADDALEPGCVAAMVEVLAERPTVSLAGCARVLSDAHLLALRIAGVRTQRAVISGSDLLAECFFFGNRIGEPTAVMFRRADAQRGFSEHYRVLVDMEMWFHLLSKGDFAALAEPLCRFRTHPEQATNAYERSGGIFEDRKLLFQDFARFAGKSAGPTRRWVWDMRMAYLIARMAPGSNNRVKDAAAATFFPRAFARLTYPAVKLMTGFGLKRVWRTP